MVVITVATNVILLSIIQTSVVVEFTTTDIKNNLINTTQNFLNKTRKTFQFL